LHIWMHMPLLVSEPALRALIAPCAPLPLSMHLRGSDAKGVPSGPSAPGDRPRPAGRASPLSPSSPPLPSSPMPAPVPKTNGVSAEAALAPKKPSRNQLKRDKKKARKHATPSAATDGAGETTTDAESSVGGTDTESEMDFELEVRCCVSCRKVSSLESGALYSLRGAASQAAEGRWELRSN
jgi:hypothetical protein